MILNQTKRKTTTHKKKLNKEKEYETKCQKNIVRVCFGAPGDNSNYSWTTFIFSIGTVICVTQPTPYTQVIIYTIRICSKCRYVYTKKNYTQSYIIKIVWELDDGALWM